MIRKFKRDYLRKQVGNKNLSSAWMRFQKNKYGAEYISICRKKGK